MFDRRMSLYGAVELLADTVCIVVQKFMNVDVALARCKVMTFDSTTEGVPPDATSCTTV